MMLSFEIRQAPVSPCLPPVLPVAPQRRLTAREVMDDFCARNGIRREDLTGPRRHQPLARLRQDAYVEVWFKCPHLSFPAIGRAFGGRDHTTVLHGLKAYCKRHGIEYASLRRPARVRMGLPA